VYEYGINSGTDLGEEPTNQHPISPTSSTHMAEVNLSNRVENNSI
jgi:hypothetical protein